MEKLGEIIDRLAPLRPPAHLEGRVLSFDRWVRAVGPRIAERTEPVALHGGVLRVRVASAAWANELSLLASDIIARIGTCGVEVRELRFVIGPLTQPRDALRRPRRQAPRPRRDLPGPLQEALAEVGDPDLRRALASAARLTLGERQG